MDLSITTDYATSLGCPEPALRRIADAGYTHVHWCHQWDTDFLYDDAEIRAIAGWLADYRLRVTDLHGSDGKEKRWYSAREYEREAGVALVANRIAMTARLGSDVVIMHAGGPDAADDPANPHRDRIRRSLDALQPVARDHGVRIALENGYFDVIEPLLADYPPDYLGLCYDCGHGNLVPDGLDRLDGVKDRLLSVHLHDNDGQADQHLPPFTATVDWDRLAGILARSAYRKPVSMESAMHHSGIPSEEDFLATCHAAGMRLTGQVASHS